MLTFRPFLAAFALVLASCTGSSGNAAEPDTTSTTGEVSSSSTATEAPSTTVPLPDEPPLDNSAVLTLDVEADGSALLRFPGSQADHGTCWEIEQWDGADWNLAQFRGFHGPEMTFRAVDPLTADCELTLVTASELPVVFPDLGAAWVRLCEVSQDRPCSNAVLVGA